MLDFFFPEYIVKSSVKVGTNAVILFQSQDIVDEKIIEVEVSVNELNCSYLLFGLSTYLKKIF